MTCFNPIEAFRTPDGIVFHEKARFDILGRIEVACGQCLGCRVRRAQEWAVRCTHEAQCWKENCFVTLTYSDEHLPGDGSLNHRHFELFMKRARDRIPGPLRYFMCGEYGEETQRPHYHAVMFNVEFRPWKMQGKSGSGNAFYSNTLLTELWGLGHCTVQPVTVQTVGYCTRYCVGKLTGELGKIAYGERKPPYCAVSNRPGIGSLWYECFGQEKAAQDYIVFNGAECRMPRYYDKLSDRKGWLTDEVEFARYERAKSVAADNTSERLQVREQVAKARMRKQERKL